MPVRSLWLYPQRRSAIVLLARFEDYPYFFDFLTSSPFTSVDDPRALTVRVRWGSYRKWLVYPIVGDDPEEEEAEWEFIEHVADLIKAGVDVPPLVEFQSGAGADGVHRANAAHLLKLRVAPIMVLPP